MRRLSPLIFFYILKICQLPAATALVPSNNNKLSSLPSDTALFVAASYEDLIQTQPRRLKLPSRFRKPASPIKARRRRTWEESYDLLLRFYKEHEHANVPSHYKQDPKLGAWVTRQRRSKSRLSSHQIAQLDTLKITWEGTKHKKANQQWQEMFQCLVDFQQQEGHCRVPRTFKANQKLARWIQSQRQAYTMGSKRMTPDRIRTLESIGFAWRLRPFQVPHPDDCLYREELWESRLRELVDYRAVHGHCRVPLGYKENPTLGNWVKTQRQLHCEGHLQAHRQDRLDAIDFTWGFDEIREEAWLTSFHQLDALMERHHYELPCIEQSTWCSQGELWAWEVNQQNAQQRGILNPHRRALLEDIGYWKSLGLDYCCTK